MIKKELLDRRLAQQTAIARKVYQAIPIEEAWTHIEIYREFVRLHGTSVEVRTVGGCVSSLVDSGLVRQVQRDRYRREPVKEAQQEKVRLAHANRLANREISEDDLDTVDLRSKEPEAEQVIRNTIAMTKKDNATNTVKKDPLERLLDLSEQLAALTESSRKIAEEIGELALEFTDERELIVKEKRQVEQLRTLLNTIMTPGGSNV